MIVEIAQYCAGVLLIAGALLGLLASVGLLRLPDLYTRMHAASKAGTLASGLIFVSISIVSFNASVSLRAVVGVLFLVLTTPVSAHLLARAAYLAGLRPTELTVIDDFQHKDKD